jgi:DNA polymerase I
VRDYLEGVKAFAKKNGYTKTLFGRRRNFPNINSPAPFLKSLAERTAINAPIQGTAADIIKLAIRYAEEDLERAGLSGETRLLLVIHDELVYEVKENALSRSAEVIERAMASVLERSFISRKTDVPLHVHLESGSNLGEVK